ncbi:MAG: MFS transporter [Anaerolineales bacterium]|nr:MFS transporter [Anaerolineales bacterium]
MNLKRRYWRLKSAVTEYPRNFWIVVGVTFIDRLGGAILWPFFTLYVTEKFSIGMTQVGLLFGVFSIMGIFGTTIGGALTDRIGRKKMIIFGLVASAISSIWLGLAESLDFFVLGALTVGFLADLGGPARQALIADILPAEQRAEGFGILRVTVNLSVTIGPAIGGLLATQSYLLLFLTDAVASTFVAFLFTIFLPETRTMLSNAPKESIWSTFKGYGNVVKDRFFMVFWGASILMALVYLQMNSTMAVYLRDFHSIPARGFGYILSLNAAMVVLFQFAITRRVRGKDPFKVMAQGMFLYAIGFGLYGVFSDLYLFMFAMAIITVGEMLVSPVQQALVAEMAPEDMRGRYMAFFGFSWAIPAMIGPLLGGIILDYLDPRLLWLMAFLIGSIATVVYILLDRWRGRLKQDTFVAPAP